MNDIDILEEKIKIIESLCTDDCINKETVIKPFKYAISTLIAENKKLKENNKKLTDEYLIQKDLINPDFLKDYISKDKIKAKIEEINKEMLNEENSLELFYRKKYCKEVLQSLLRKE